MHQNDVISLTDIQIQADVVVYEVEWSGLTRIKNAGFPQGKQKYTLPRKVAMELMIIGSGILREFEMDFGENSNQKFGVALWDKGPNGEDFAWIAWGDQLRPYVVDLESDKRYPPKFDFYFPANESIIAQKNNFGRTVLTLAPNENSILPYGSANERKNRDFV